ncbi:hypothetical protein J4E05_13390 [Thalassospira sp. NFXS8]|uniref:hypothetical protein n=1 Tax=Thalassospira sp. NFXS8 TaxID=2819093 RepID=UPI0032DFDC85
MQIDVTEIYAENLNAPNDVYLLENQLADLKLAGFTWLTSMRHKNNGLNILFNHVFEEIRSWDTSLTPTLISGNSAWRLETRITNYKKYLKHRQETLSQSSSFKESIEEKITRNKEVKYFAAAKLKKENLIDAFDILMSDRITAIAFTNGEKDTHDLLCNGWEDEYPVDHDLLARICRNGGILLKKVGEFDDLKIGFTAFFPKYLIDPSIMESKKFYRINTSSSGI